MQPLQTPITMVSVELNFFANGVKYNLPIPNDAEFPTSINRAVSDYEDIKSRKGDFTKTIKVQANQLANKVFQSLFKPYIAQDSAVVASLRGDNENVKCVLLVNGLVHMAGYAKIKTASSFGGQPLYYEITVYSSMNDWASQFAEMKLRDLSLGTYIWNYANIRAASENDGGWPANSSNHVYPLIDYGDIGNKTGAYGSIMDYELRPAPYIKAIIKQAFTQIGYTLSSDFFDNLDISRLIYPFTSGNWERPFSLYNQYRAKVSWSSQQDLTSNIGANPTVINADPQSQILLNQNLNFQMPLIINVNQGGLRNGNAFTFTPTQSGTFTISGSFIMTTGNNSYGVQFMGGSTVLLNLRDLGIGSNNTTINFSFDYFLTANVKYSIAVLILYTTIPIYINPTSYVQFTPQKQIEIGGIFDLAYTLPDKSVMEFMQGIFQLFNLVFDTNPQNKNITIEAKDAWVDSTGATVNGFYLPTSSAVDYSAKQQQHLESKLDFIANYKIYQFWCYKNDSADGVLTEREKRTKHRYGGYRHKLFDRFIKGEDKIENSHFAPTYMGYKKLGGQNGYIPTVSGYYQNTLVPIMANNMTNGVDNASYTFEPRILYFKYSTHLAPYAGSSGSYNYEWSIRQSNGNGVNGYGGPTPRAFFIDVDGEVDFSLLYNDCDIPAFNATDRVGLFNRFWSKTVPVINEGVKGSVFFKYLEIDNLNFNFRKLLYTDSVYWIVNKIIDYKPAEQTFTKFELILKNELGKAANQTQTDGIDGWASPYDSGTSGEMINFNIGEDDGISTSTGESVNVIIDKVITLVNTKPKPTKAQNRKQP